MTNMIVPEWLERFVTESNRIEGILGTPSGVDIIAHERFLALNTVATADMEGFVAAIAPGHRLRSREGLNVRVGNHIPPPGGMHISGKLDAILHRANAGEIPHKLHHEYETLHPFTDGNGRSGRALWLWGMLRSPYAERARRLGFLHTWYYQSLENGYGR